MAFGKEIDKKKSIGQVAEELGVRTHVIRFWESKFPQIKPEIGRGSRRYYFKKDVEILKKIQTFLYEEGYTIVGLQKLLKQRKKDTREIKKEDDLQPLLKAEDSFLAKDNDDPIQKSLFSSIKQDDKELVSKSIEQIEFNLNQLATLLKTND